MQKWSPEPFETPQTPAGGLVVDPDAFEGDAHAARNAGLFRKESGFADRASLMNALTPEERTEIFELVEMDVAAEYAAREEEQAAAFASEIATLKASYEERFEGWTARLAAEIAEDLKQASEAAARLAVQLAEKIVRARVAADRDVLARGIATVLYKLESEDSLTVHVSGEDAAWLNEQPALREKLNIAAVSADRRLETGGAIVRTDNREWDVTLNGQLETLSEIVEEMLATSDAQRPGDGDEPGLV